MTSTEAVKSTREPNFLLARHEKRVLNAIARRLPRWILPDDLTALGVVSAVAICIAYQATNVGRGWLWVASGLLVVHWLGDSLDGTLARVRVNGVATVGEDDPLMDDYDGAQFVVRVKATEVFPNCPRYIHRMQLVERSKFVPRAECAPPVPGWKRKEWARDVLPAGDPASEV